MEQVTDNEKSLGLRPEGSLLHRTQVKKEKTLIQCSVDMDQLSTYMNQIIQVVNQHAKLLDQVTHEIAIRPKKQDLGDMFNILSHSFPYKCIIEGYGQDPNQALPRSIFITEQLLKRNIKMNVALEEQQKQPVEGMWDGFDRFLKVQELNGRLSSDL
jgi:hypothetical protein